MSPRTDWTPAEREQAAACMRAVVALQAAANRQAAFDLVVSDAVRVLRDGGVSWALIGEALGVSRQAAWERWGGVL